MPEMREEGWGMGMSSVERVSLWRCWRSSSPLSSPREGRGASALRPSSFSPSFTGRRSRQGMRGGADFQVQSARNPLRFQPRILWIPQRPLGLDDGSEALAENLYFHRLAGHREIGAQ